MGGEKQDLSAQQRLDMTSSKTSNDNDAITGSPEQKRPETPPTQREKAKLERPQIKHTTTTLSTTKKLIR